MLILIFPMFSEGLAPFKVVCAQFPRMLFKNKRRIRTLLDSELFPGFGSGTLTSCTVVL